MPADNKRPCCTTTIFR